LTSSGAFAKIAVISKGAIMKGKHFHSGLVAAIYITVVAVVGLNVLRLAAAGMTSANIPGGKPLGGLVTFGAN
jgi:hypothetical protein